MMKIKPIQSSSAAALDRIFEETAACWQRHDYDASIEVLKRGTRLAPAHPKLQFSLGVAYGMCFDFETAKKHFERSIQFSTEKTEKLTQAAACFRRQGRFDLAEEFLQRAGKQPDASADVLAGLAEIHERHSRPAEAAVLVERALRLDASNVRAGLVVARGHRHAGRVEEGEKALRSLLSNSPRDAWAKAQVLYELGANLDRQGRYDDAMTSFLEAKAALLPTAGVHLRHWEVVENRLREMTENMTSDVLKQWREMGEQLQPARRLAVLCGHPRSGTTLLEQVLDAHPEIVSAEETQLMYQRVCLGMGKSSPIGSSFRSMLESTTTPQLRQLREVYFRGMESFLGQPIGKRLLVDKNPALTMIIPGPIRVFPEVQFIVALRDPRDVCWSSFVQAVPVGPFNVSWLTLEKTVSNYVRLMNFWQTMKSRISNPVIEVRYEDMVADLEPVARKTLGFLGAAWEEKVLRFDEAARKKIVRSPTYADVAKPIFKTAIGRWRNYQKYLEPHLNKLAPLSKAFGYE